MSESRPERVFTFLEDFREEIIAGTSSPEAFVEAWTSRELVPQEEAITGASTPADQMRALFHTVARGTPQTQANFYQLLKEKEAELVSELEQRCQNNKATQTELTWTQTQPEIHIKSKKEKILRQKQLINEIIRETRTIWKDRQGEKEAFHILNKATRLVKEIEELWETVEHEENRQKLQLDIDKRYVEEMHSRVQCEKSELERTKSEIQTEKTKLEHDRQVAKAELDELNDLRESVEKQNEELDEKLRSLKTQVREMEATGTEATLRKNDLIKAKRTNRRKEGELTRMKEEIERDANAQLKWINFQLQKKKRSLDRRLERTMRERDELDVMKAKMKRQREELRRRTEDVVAKVLSVARVKDGMRAMAEELDGTRGELREVQREARENREEVERHVITK